MKTVIIAYERISPMVLALRIEKVLSAFAIGEILTKISSSFLLCIAMI